MILNKGCNAFISSVKFIISDNRKILYQILLQFKKIAFSESEYITVYDTYKVTIFRVAKFLGQLFSNSSLTRNTSTTNNLVNI